MPLTFKDKNVTVTGRDANILAGFAIFGIITSAVTVYRLGYAIGFKSVDVISNIRERRLNKKLH